VVAGRLPATAAKWLVAGGVAATAAVEANAPLSAVIASPIAAMAPARIGR
jgi:hypothetical protein